MRLSFAIPFAWLVVALPLAHAAPARLPYHQPTPKAAGPADLIGTSWIGSDIESGDWEITFEKDGNITYSYNGRTFRNGSWKWEAGELYFETNKKFYEFRGSVQGNFIDGESWNVKGIRWPTSMYRAGTK